ncbi:E4 SUMO-protein ligase PIAL2 isoform X1 [Jatropha curcas]|uniref:E4 SUMO-protein ligase PIAL2 isoform X1 n=2 Tax=Jatropha curcas TaxID=180498 RepID=UPI0018948404|nr:E4 SUMO-protein ligase PIAL2 isoform X1 [Jatropha curcas]XP_037495080.1 E4 SUMO-protein ligase PIAL2 isoform X1 [Jatropha curcas]XP_037495081.1 E4 SUMO-protein ligase PIAL2 isoform X1 [Jatropha curcas]
MQLHAMRCHRELKTCHHCLDRMLAGWDGSQIQIRFTFLHWLKRFYPKIKMGCVLVSLKVKHGYRAVVADFQVLNKTVASPQVEIGLFVAQIDNMNTSSCLVTPPQANLLVNGKGVQGRVNVSLDTGPQLPTNLTAILNCGMNVLQAVGQFDGDFIIVIAYMHEMSSFDPPVLQEYVQPVEQSDSSSDIMDKPTQISLNCPISNKRIRTPIKGHCCKHHQCFDFESFMILNSRRPLWCCPICNQSICYIDICIDKNIGNILREVGESAVDVIVSANGSWKVVFESSDDTDQTHHAVQGCQKERPEPHESSGLSSVPVDFVDLTMEEDNTSYDIESVAINGANQVPSSLSHNQALRNINSLMPMEPLLLLT